MRVTGVLLSAVLCVFPTVLASQNPEAPLAPERGVAPQFEALGGAPLYFEVNQGQADDTVRFLSRGPNYGIFVRERETVLTLTRGALGEPRESAAVRIRFVGASEAAALVAGDTLPGVSNYYRGKDPAHWRTGIPHVDRVVCQQLYRGIDLVYHGQQGVLEYDFVVAPGVNPDVICMSFNGAESLDLDDAGNLVIRTAAGEITHRAPYIYQDHDGQRTEVAGRFVLSGVEVRFEVEDYDATRTLVIDPQLVFTAIAGGTGVEHCDGMAVDDNGDIYLGGWANSAGLPTPVNGHSGGDFDVLLARFSSDGSILEYVTYLGGSTPPISQPNWPADDGAHAVTVDASGNLYFAGLSTATDFPTTLDAYQDTSDSFGVIFGKLDSTGALAYASYFGGPNNEIAFGIALGPNDTIYLTGWAAPDMPTTAGAYDETNEATFGGNNVFLAKFDITVTPSSDQLLYSTYIGNGEGGDEGKAIAVDSAGDAHIAVQTSVDNRNGTVTGLYPTTSNAFRPNVDTCRNCTFDAAAYSKISPGGNGADDLVYSTFLTDPSLNRAVGIAVDADDVTYVVGMVFTDDFETTTGAYQTQRNGSSDVFLAVLDTALSGSASLLYGTYLGSSLQDNVEAVAVDDDGNVYLVGHTRGGNTAGTGTGKGKNKTQEIDFPTTADAFAITPAGSDIFVVKLDPAGNGESDLLFSSLFGGDGADTAYGVAVQGTVDVEVVVAGTTDSTDFTTGDDNYTYGVGGDSDAVFFKLSFAAPAVGTVSGTVTNADGGAPIAGALVELDTGESDVTISDGSYTIANAPAGSRTVTASAAGFVSQNQNVTVTDGATTTVNFVLDATSGSGTVSVASVTYSSSGGRNGDKHITVTITIIDDTEAAVSDATVDADVDNGGPLFSFSGTTDSGGEVSFTISNAPNGTYVTTVTDVVASGLTFVGGTPTNSFTK